jgi:hypothetical protein
MGAPAGTPSTAAAAATASAPSTPPVRPAAIAALAAVVSGVSVCGHGLASGIAGGFPVTVSWHVADASALVVSSTTPFQGLTLVHFSAQPDTP